MIFNLPIALVKDILANWLCLEAVTRLDTACCNRKVRLDYLFSVANSTRADNVRANDPRWTQWITSRRVVVSSIIVKMSVNADGEGLRNANGLPHFLENSCTAVKSVEITYASQSRNKSISSQVLHLIAAIKRFCPSVTELRLTGYDVGDEVLLALTADMPNLVKIDVNYCYALTSKAFQNIATQCSKLELLHANGCQMQHGMLAKITANCPLLRDLSCKLADTVSHTPTCLFPSNLCLRRLEVSGLDSRGIECIADNCSMLEALNLSNGAAISAGAWAYIFRSAACRDLRELQLSGCKRADWAALAEVHRLHKLHIDECDALTNAHLLSVAYANPGLSDLTVTNCRYITYMAVLSLLDNCPSLRHVCVATRDSGHYQMTELVLECLKRLYPHIESLDVEI
jgi:hypothetical protein